MRRPPESTLTDTLFTYSTLVRSPSLSSKPARRPGGRQAFDGSRKEHGASVQVQVRDNNVDQPLRALQKKLQREGVFREMKLRRNFEKPSARKKRERAEAVRRYRNRLPTPTRGKACTPWGFPEGVPPRRPDQNKRIVRPRRA